MPTYEYRCPQGHTFDVFQKMSDEPGADCPECGKAAERQLSGGAGFLFKGDGFYITDYRSEGYKKAAQKDQAKQESASGGSSSTSGGDGGSAKGTGSSGSGSESGSGSSGSSTSSTSSASASSPASPSKKAD